MSTQHTPTPWQITGVDGYARRFVSDSKGNQVAFCAPIQPMIERGMADAVHIVRCVNSHDALVKALSDLLAMSERWLGGADVSGSHYEQTEARAALKAATESNS